MCIRDSLHGEPTQAVATLVFDNSMLMDAKSVKAVNTSYELLSEDCLLYTSYKSMEKNKPPKSKEQER